MGLSYAFCGTEAFRFHRDMAYFDAERLTGDQKSIGFLGGLVTLSNMVSRDLRMDVVRQGASLLTQEAQVRIANAIFAFTKITEIKRANDGSGAITLAGVRAIRGTDAVVKREIRFVPKKIGSTVESVLLDAAARGRIEYTVGGQVEQDKMLLLQHDPDGARFNVGPGALISTDGRRLIAVAVPSPEGDSILDMRLHTTNIVGLLNTVYEYQNRLTGFTDSERYITAYVNEYRAILKYEGHEVEDEMIYMGGETSWSEAVNRHVYEKTHGESLEINEIF